jgi:putative restriction endonuclease
MKVIFDTKANSGYDDDITWRYHFPRQYRGLAEACVNDWIVYREPQRNGGRRAYVAVARVRSVEMDEIRPGHAYAYVSDYLEFDEPVPFASESGYREAALRVIENPSRVGAALQGRSIRQVSEADFASIAYDGLRETIAPENAIRLELSTREIDEDTRALLIADPVEQERRIAQMLINKKIRAASFRKKICEAYGDRCAVTGLRLVNGGGKSEVQAAHIKPVAAGGPDTVQNGIALSATVHWLFDRHLISLTDDFGLLVSHNRVPSELRSLFTQQGDRIHLPADRRLWPHPAYLRHHREGFASH